MPQRIDGIYYEPFLGSAAVAVNFANRAKQGARLSDANICIAEFYQSLVYGRVSPMHFGQHLLHEGKELARIGERHYYSVRERFNSNCNVNELALDLLFLNRTCYNGLMRFNRSGDFNVPFCKNQNRLSAKFCASVEHSAEQTMAALSGGEIEHCDWENSINTAGNGDFIFLDPPYLGLEANYIASGWSEKDENDLYAFCLNTPAKFMLTTWAEKHGGKPARNEFFYSRWAKNFNVREVEHQYIVGPKAINRGRVVEAIVTNY
jgi:DNA adenine methylase